MSNKQKVPDLLDACMDGKLDEAKELIEEIGDVNCDVHGRTPALHAAYGGHVDVLRYTVEKGANVNRQLDTGATPLHYACQGGHLEAVKYLVNEANADLTLRDINGRTPLLNTCYLGNIPIIKVLLAAGDDLNVQDSGGFNCVATACEGGLIEVAELLIQEGATLGVPGWNGNNELHLAACNGFHNVVKMLIEKGANPETCNYYGYTAAQVAAAFLTGDKEQYLPHVLDKLGLPSDERPSPPERVSIDEFIREGQPVMKKLGLHNVLVIKRDHLLMANEMPHYDSCEKNGWHLTVESLPKGSKILFVSHRWGGVEFPDPGELQYKIVEHYLKSEKGQDIEYIWLDYASICQEKGSEKFWAHLQNIPTAVWCSTRCLIIPQVNMVDRAYEEGDCEITDLADYVDRAWCLFEAMASMLTGTDVTCAFQLGPEIKMVPFTKPEGSSSSMGFFQSFVDVSHQLLNDNNRDWQYVGQDNLNTKWQVQEPCAVLGLLMKIVREDQKYGFVLGMARTLEVKYEDIEEAGDDLKELWDKMGNCSFVEDKIVVLNLMLFVGVYSLNKKVFSSSTNIRPLVAETFTASNTVVEINDEKPQESSNVAPPAPEVVVVVEPKVSKKGCGCLVM
mmetsp:Transcript_10251/g.13364  ORF Transcript_10251/g.13364 Transcript_10251/m.13364 type:complete len:620 (+) Transcript_10251:209-2068(+)